MLEANEVNVLNTAVDMIQEPENIKSEIDSSVIGTELQTAIIGSMTAESEDDITDEAAIAAIRRYAVLSSEKKSAKGTLESITAEMTEIEEKYAEYMAVNSPKVKVRIGGSDEKPVFRTVFVKRLIVAGHTGDKNALVEAMKRNGLESLVSESYNSRSFESWVRDIDPSGKLTVAEIHDKLPEEMKPLVKIDSLIKLGTTAK